MEELANSSLEWKRTIELYKQLCRTTELRCIRDDPKVAWEYYKSQYAEEMSLSEKLAELSNEEDNS